MVGAKCAAECPITAQRVEGYLSDREWADIVAYMLSVRGMPADQRHLP
jgi:hypothetical protein